MDQYAFLGCPACILLPEVEDPDDLGFLLLGALVQVVECRPRILGKAGRKHVLQDEKK